MLPVDNAQPPQRGIEAAIRIGLGFLLLTLCASFAGTAFAKVDSSKKTVQSKKQIKAADSNPAQKKAPAGARKRLVATSAAALSAVAVVAAAQPAPAPGAHAEQRLLEIYALIGQGNLREARKLAHKLTLDTPNFQLAQLLYGDLLLAQAQPLKSVGSVPAPLFKEGESQLQELRSESMLRIRALQAKPPRDQLPAQFLTLPRNARHVIAVDASRARLYVFENGDQGARLVRDMYMSVGKLGIDKRLEGDQKTPLGVYYITSKLPSKKLPEFYGAGALPINFPNEYDKFMGRTGSGIWLHGTPPEQYTRAPLATDGCVVLSNPDLQWLMRNVDTQSTVVLIARQLQWNTREQIKTKQENFNKFLDAWSETRKSGSLDQLKTWYAPGFWQADVSNLPRFDADYLRTKGKSLELKNLSVTSWQDQNETMVVSFGEVIKGEVRGLTRKQYWIKMGKDWKILHESTSRP